jgi:hypothetical protein
VREGGRVGRREREGRRDRESIYIYICIYIYACIYRVRGGERKSARANVRIMTMVDIKVRMELTYADVC